MHPPIDHTLLRRLSLVLLVPLIVTGGCGGSTSEPRSDAPSTPTPPADPAVRVVVVGAPKTAGAPTAYVGQFVVRVEDAAGKGVAGSHVRFRAPSGRPGYQFLPTDTTTTDAEGLARAGVYLGTVAGPDQLSAAAGTQATPATVDVVVTPGAPAYVRIAMPTTQLFGAGDSVSFTAFVVDLWNNVVPDTPFNFQISDSTLLSVREPVVQGGDGVIRALRSGGTATIRSAGPAASPLVTVTVSRSTRDACAGIATPQTLVGNQPITVADSVLCLAADAETGYTVMVYNESMDGARTLGTTVDAYNVAASYYPARVPEPMPPALSRSATLLRRAQAPTADLRFHERLLERSRVLRRLFAPARAARSVARLGGSTGPRLSYSIVGTGGTVPAVNDLIPLNVAEAPCADPDMRTFRVLAVGSRSIVLADTANPPGGFGTADYERFAARFDTLIYPLDVDAFGAPSDIDANGRVAILFTRAVNELTPENADSYVGGFFHPRDLFPRAGSPTVAVCETSNEGELVYMMVPDPLGVVHGNKFSRGMVDTLTTSVLAHELQHLINASRRMYVNTAAQEFEETWLNEGLSHIAEELLYFRESALSPRWNLTARRINDTWQHFVPWVSDDASNFVRFYLFLLDPENHSPIDVGDALETRGASWAFLRFAVDRSYSSDGGVWQLFGNSTTTGLNTLAAGLQRDPKPLLREFALANMIGGHPSWDYVSVYKEVFVGGIYPLKYGKLLEGATPVSAKGGSAGYYRFRTIAGSQALLRFGSSAAPRDANLTFVVTRQAY
jgi:hypothetical protein